MFGQKERQFKAFAERQATERYYEYAGRTVRVHASKQHYLRSLETRRWIEYYRAMNEGKAQALIRFRGYACRNKVKAA